MFAVTAQDCLFCKIANKEIPSDIVHEDDHAVAFKDIDPQAPVHLLIVPRKHIPTHADLEGEDVPLMGHIHRVALELAQQQGIADTGYRIVINCREQASQSVWHLHVHLLGGRSLGWPPG